ncbi:alpha/beta-hydrolase [Penicillium cf. griseofulvum]|nr:alpha/beta-hydrolase [Penicillium cf. griseofulvum]
MGSISLPHQQIVQCKTIDGISLEGWFFQVDGPAPAVIMSHGFNCVKEMSLEDTARSFQSAGYNVLIYDARSIGGSGGFPRNQINPHQMIEDVSDVVTYVGSLPSVDSRRIMLWGMSFGATVSGIAASIDRRVVAVLMVCPIFSMVRPDKRKTAFAQLIKDRQSQLRGNEPFTIQPFNSKGENPIGYAGSGGSGGKEGYRLMKAAADRGHPNFRDRVTLQSYHKMALFRPKELLEVLEDVPVMMMIPELDDISPAEEQQAAFKGISAPKRLHLAEGAGHMSILTGEGSGARLQAMLDFFDDALNGNIE